MFVPRLLTSSRSVALGLLCLSLPALADCTKFCGARDQLDEVEPLPIRAMDDHQLYASASALVTGAMPMAQRWHNAQWLAQSDYDAQIAMAAPSVSDWLEALDADVLETGDLRTLLGDCSMQLSMEAFILQLQRKF